MRMDKNVCVFRTFTCHVLRNGVHSTRKPAFQMGMCGLAPGVLGTEWRVLVGSMTNSHWNLNSPTFGLVSKSYVVFVWLLFILLKACLCCFVFILCSVPHWLLGRKISPHGCFLAVPLLCQVCKGCLVFPSHPCVCQSDLRRRVLDLCLTCVS